MRISSIANDRFAGFFPFNPYTFFPCFAALFRITSRKWNKSDSSGKPLFHFQSQD